MSLTIVGGGLAGLLAAHAWPQVQVLESSTKPKAEHKALLRFRSDAVARLTGIDFQKVTVRKGIWLDGQFIQPNVRAANMYAQKVTGALTGDRSLWNLEPVERFIAPETFYEDLIANVGSRITWGHEFDFKRDPRDGDPIINTAPLPLVLDKIWEGLESHRKDRPNFKRAPIAVHRFRIRNANVYQTIYFPWSEARVYRASMTGSMLIMECMTGGDYFRPMSAGQIDYDELMSVLEAFSINRFDIEQIDSVEQKYGKIVPLPDGQRKALLHDLTQHHGIFSLGRFATWRNILLDDVVQDIAVLRRLMRASSYDRRIHAS